MGQSKPLTTLPPNGMRLLEQRTTSIAQSADAGGMQTHVESGGPSGEAPKSVVIDPIEQLVDRLQFQNPDRAAAFLRANPSILGQSRLLPALAKQLQ